ncbi:MAG TPA: glycosyltransferase family 39 protein [Thermoanaerobaculia bacterium]|nr:glycosyltransferase family 39 protein [Thermoanaerobaculia bacterium]
MLTFAVTRAALIGAIALSAYGFGAPFLGRLRLAGPGERVAFGVTLGLGVLGTASLLLGLVGALHRTTVMILAAAGVALAVYSVGQHRAAAEDGLPCRGWLRTATIAIGAAAFALTFARALYPPTAFDATLYHLPMAKAYAAHGRVAPNPDLRFPVFPALNETLFADAMLLGDDVTAQLVETLFFGLLTLGVAAWGARAAGAPAAFWASALWIANPVVVSLASVAYVDMGLAAFGFFAVYASARWLESEDPRWAGLAGAFAGFAAATKYSGLFFVVLVAALLALRRSRRALLVFLAAAAAAGGTSYASNALWTGNPVWPFGGWLFGLRYWNSNDVASLDWSLRSYGWGRSALDLLRLPYRLVFEQPGAEPRVLPLLFVLFPLAVWAAIRRRELRWPAAAAAAYLVFWFAATQQIRFLLPVVPVLSVLGASGLFAAVERTRSDWRRRWRVAVTIGMATLAAAALVVVFRGVWTNPPVPTTLSERERYLERLMSYPFYRDLNRQTRGNYAVYAFHDENMRYYCDGRHLGDWFGPNRYADVPLTTARALFDWLRKRGVSYLIVNQRARVPLPTGEDFASLFENVYTKGPIVAYALRQP